MKKEFKVGQTWRYTYPHGSYYVHTNPMCEGYPPMYLVYGDVFLVLAIGSAKGSCFSNKSAFAIEILTKYGNRWLYMVPDNYWQFQLLLDKPNNTL